jgi:predicted DNA-binding protein
MNLKNSIGGMPTLSFHMPQKLEHQVRQAAKRRGVTMSQYLKKAVEHELERQKTSFGEFARRVAGIVNSGEKDLSMREGFDD